MTTEELLDRSLAARLAFGKVRARVCAHVVARSLQCLSGYKMYRRAADSVCLVCPAGRFSTGGSRPTVLRRICPQT